MKLVSLDRNIFSEFIRYRRNSNFYDHPLYIKLLELVKAKSIAIIYSDAHLFETKQTPDNETFCTLKSIIENLTQGNYIDQNGKYIKTSFSNAIESGYFEGNHSNNLIRIFQPSEYNELLQIINRRKGSFNNLPKSEV